MRTAETILTVIRTRGSNGLPLERVYRLLFNPELYLRAYARLYPNKGALTPGVTGETVDGMAVAKIEQLIDDLRYERYRWTPTRRTYIPKRNGTKRPLGIPTWRDKLLQDVIRQILEAYFEPQFSPHAHGFRPNRGCHTALQTIQRTWKGTRWFIEGDIATYFDTINHDILLRILGEHINDGRFLRLIRELLEAGYMEDWTRKPTLSGTPQGGVLSPLLSNIYLHRFDQWVETTLLPAYTRGESRKPFPAYTQLSHQIQTLRRNGNHRAAQQLIKQRRQLPSKDPQDEDYRKLVYVRYADDFLLGFAGPRNEAEAIKQLIKTWLGDHLKITLSDEKTLITHATTERARFLGYEITTGWRNDKLDRQGRRVVNGVIELRVPADVVEAKCARYQRGGLGIHRPELLKLSDYDIVTTYQQEYRGVVQYYLHAHNIGALSKLQWIMRGSLLKTLASKHKSTITKLARQLTSTVQTADGASLRCLEVSVTRADKPPLIARFGGISLSRQPHAALSDQPFIATWSGRSELIQRLLAEQCELCGSRNNIEVHHVRKLADLIKKGRKEKPQWVQRMAALRRKTLVVCHSCHVAIHAGRPTGQRESE